MHRGRGIGVIEGNDEKEVARGVRVIERVGCGGRGNCERGGGEAMIIPLPSYS